MYTLAELHSIFALPGAPQPQPQQLYGTAAGGFGHPHFGGGNPAFGFGAAGGAPFGFAAHGFGVGGLGAQDGMEEGEEAVDTVDTYAAAGAYVAAGPADLQQQAPFLLPQLAPFAGRHIITVGVQVNLGTLSGPPACCTLLAYALFHVRAASVAIRRGMG